MTLGTAGGPPVHAERSQIANALIVGDAVYLFDVGNGVRRQMAMAQVPEVRLKAVFLSHHHPDHNADLGTVMVSHWTLGSGTLDVIGPDGTRTLVDGLVAANAPTVLASFPTGGPAKPALAQSVKVIDTGNPAKPTLVYKDDRIEVEAISVPHYQVAPSIPLAHMPEAVAYRVKAGGKVYVYTGDSGPTDQLVTLAKGADVLVTEVVEPQAIGRQLTAMMANAPAPLRDAIIGGMTHNHLVPGEVGRIAKAAGVGQVVLTHFVPSPEASGDIAAYTRDIGRQFSGKVTMAKDLDRF